MAIEMKVKKAFDSFELELAFQTKSRRIGILGASGSGKSMTLKMLAGIERPDEGRIAVDGVVLYDGLRHVNLPPQKRKVGYLFQNYALFPTMTVEKNIGMGLRGKKEEKKKRVQEIMERFRLSELKDRLPSQLSGGQQQRTALARMLVCEPEVILLDEPFSALDVYLKDKMQRECMELLADYPGTVVFVSHSRDEIFRFSEETFVLDDGAIVEQNETKALFRYPKSRKTARLTGCKNIAKITGEEKPGTVRVPKWGIDLAVEVGALKPGETVTHVGIRAHEFELVPNEANRENKISIYDPEVTEDLFEYNVAFRPSREAEGTMDWKVSKYALDLTKEKLPEAIYLRKERILLLQ